MLQEHWLEARSLGLTGVTAQGESVSMEAKQGQPGPLTAPAGDHGRS